jgi:hypothetical protein
MGHSVSDLRLKVLFTLQSLFFCLCIGPLVLELPFESFFELFVPCLVVVSEASYFSWGACSVGGGLAWRHASQRPNPPEKKLLSRCGLRFPSAKLP